MALTLQERFNLAKGVPIANLGTEPVLPTDRIDAQLKKIAGEFITGDLLRANIPNIATFNPSDARLFLRRSGIPTG
jgi:hypothetical protein